MKLATKQLPFYQCRFCYKLNTRLGTLEIDLRAVKDTVKHMEYSEALKETKLSYSMQAIYDKLDYIQNGISAVLIPSRMN